jgi:hypothetical protein
MAMYDKSTVPKLRRQEWFTYPQHVVFGLSDERNAGSYSGMNEEPVVVVNMKRQRSDPCEMLRREIGGVIYAVSIQRLLTAVCPPLN